METRRNSNTILLPYIPWVLPRSHLVRDTKHSLLGRGYITRDFASIIKKKEVNILRYTEKKGTAKVVFQGFMERKKRTRRVWLKITGETKN